MQYDLLYPAVPKKRVLRLELEVRLESMQYPCCF
jgi:hypothetical protein